MLKEDRTAYPKYMHLENYGMLKTCRCMEWLGKVGQNQTQEEGRQAAHGVNLLHALNH